LDSVAAADSEPYQPDILTLDGEQSYVFKSDNRLSIWDGGTIEFWVAADWTEAPEYNPVILSNVGKDGLLYEIAMRADKKGLTIQSGKMLGGITFDFDDPQLHHVGLVNLGDQVIVMIDGKIVGATSLQFKDISSTELHLGASAGGSAPFHGAIAGLRIWDKAIGPETLVKFSWADSTSDTSVHPDLAFLSGHSDFNTKDFYIIEKFIIPSGIVDAQGQ
jgi:hypothetical protein